ncbi:hypothetical protein KFL_000370170 [Klebsormidium nitens]|uniref:Uncharacterized protein n=1 Tax=Klebsormidium nitens TaxID=105231 RepID=A0A1Y1HNY7_KLENI|nr:hypothetical protein KFL_000370170 [Klebsormidium nitens]|eukprot:GAQ79743.1 hypothetical protein KFL_000370170 [Klebsormidium nitens]
MNRRSMAAAPSSFKATRLLLFVALLVGSTMKADGAATFLCDKPYSGRYSSDLQLFVDYSYWRDVKNSDQYYRVERDPAFGSTYTTLLTLKIMTQCGQFVTSLPESPFPEGGWKRGPSVWARNSGLSIGAISSRSTTGCYVSAPNATAEACLKDVMRHTPPTLEYVVLFGGFITICSLVMICACYKDNRGGPNNRPPVQAAGANVRARPVTPAGYMPDSQLQIVVDRRSSASPSKQ